MLLGLVAALIIGLGVQPLIATKRSAGRTTTVTSLSATSTGPAEVSQSAKAVTPEVIAGLGDSLTYRPASWFRRTCRSGAIGTCINAGVTGNTTTQMFRRLRAEVLDQDADTIVLMGAGPLPVGTVRRRPAPQPGRFRPDGGGRGVRSARPAGVREVDRLNHREGHLPVSSGVAFLAYVVRSAMRRQEASRVVSSPLPRAMEKLRAVEEWPTFLSHVTAVTRTAHLRYTFHVVEGRAERDTPVAVTVDARKHVIRWKSISGATFAGCLTLTETGVGHTNVRLELTQHPTTMGSMATEMLAPGSTAALLDLDALDHYLTRTG